MSGKSVLCICLALTLALCTSAYPMKEHQPNTPPPAPVLGSGITNAPMILSSGGDTTWVQVHSDSGHCPGDPTLGSGGEATGGPGPRETWCFNNGPGDSCGTNPPWDTRCFNHVDVRALPSPMHINFWHIDSYRADQRAYCGDYALWCGSDSLWTDGLPVDCGTWQNTPGYGNQWHCVAQLTLPPTFDVANGCTLFFDPRYDTECNYDYFYVDVFNGTEWTTLAQFNASSNTPGQECGYPYIPHTDYWENTDTNQPNSADWQERVNPGEPAFYRVITPDTLVITSGPMFRWRFKSDGAWSDQDGRGDTDGAAFIDNVWVWGDTERYTEDFETGELDTNYWSLPDPAGVIDMWHIVDGKGPDYTWCVWDSSYLWRARPEQGYQAGTDWRNGWYYRLMSPTVPIQNTGCVIQYDAWICILEYTCDYVDTKVRVYNTSYDKWCPWTNIAGYIPWGCGFWQMDVNEDLTWFYTEDAESIQFCWNIDDVSDPWSLCRGKHKNTDFLVDNVSIGFYDAQATSFAARKIDLLHDTFFDNLCGYNSHFDTYDPDTVSRYAGPPYDTPIPRENQLYLDVTDPDGLTSVELFGSVNEGATWQSVAMSLNYPRDPGNPALGGEYYGTLCPSDFSIATWDMGTVVWYYVKATDVLAHQEYWPATANPGHADHTGAVGDYLEFTILPVHPPDFTGPRVLLVDGYQRATYDYAECLGSTANERSLQAIYEETLTDAGYCFDVFDIEGAWSYVQIHPVDYGDFYDCIVWFTGPYISNYLIDKEAQFYIRDYMEAGGKVVLCSDRLAYAMASPSIGGGGEDSLGTDGEFLGGVMASEYLEEMEGPFDKPYLYAAPAESVSVFGVPVPVDLDTLVLYRECPEPKDMSYVRAKYPPMDGYTAQYIMYLTDAWLGEAHEVMYSEYMGTGQCVFINFDLSASANHESGFCSGAAQPPAPGFAPGTYDGRVELMRFILEDVMGLPSNGGGQAGLEKPQGGWRWLLEQNSPNPCLGETSISYATAMRSHVSIKIYNAQGRLVRRLISEVRNEGMHSARWDGRDDSGRSVTSGVYFYRIEAGPFTATRKMLLLR